MFLIGTLSPFSDFKQFLYKTHGVNRLVYDLILMGIPGAISIFFLPMRTEAKPLFALFYFTLACPLFYAAVLWMLLMYACMFGGCI